MTDSSSLGSMSEAPPQRSKTEGGGWTLWENLATNRPGFSNPGAFNSCIAQSCWESFTVTLQNPEFFDAMRSEEHTSELQSQSNLVCRLLLEKKKKQKKK